jgi:hypothetical protein
MKRFLKIFAIIIVVILLLLLLFTVATWHIITTQNSMKKDDIRADSLSKLYFKNHPVKLSGYTTKTYHSHGEGIIYLKVVSTTITHYDPFVSNEKYFFYYIDSGKAEIYSGCGVAGCKVGDSVVLDIKPNDDYHLDSVYLYRNHKKNDSWNIRIWYVPSSKKHTSLFDYYGSP